jgi:hypothetical protein
VRLGGLTLANRSRSTAPLQFAAALLVLAFSTPERK